MEGTQNRLLKKTYLTYGKGRVKKLQTIASREAS
jgi:hypothetical protein